MRNRQMHRNTFSGSASWDFTNNVDPVRGFDGLGRNKGETQVSFEYMDSDTSLRLSVGAWSDFTKNTTQYDPDGSYIAQRLGGTVIYARLHLAMVGTGLDLGAVALQQRAAVPAGWASSGSTPRRSARPLLSWLGPWQAQFLVGWLDDKRISMNTGL